MKYIKYKIILLIALFPLTTLAIQELDTAAGGTGLITRKPAAIIGTIVNTLLGFLGTIFTILIILGGFKWMTSGGNEQKVQEARELLKNAVIGLLAVGLSYGAVRLVLMALKDSGSGGPASTET